VMTSVDHDLAPANRFDRPLGLIKNLGRHNTSHYNFRFWRNFHPVQIFEKNAVKPALTGGVQAKPWRSRTPAHDARSPSAWPRGRVLLGIRTHRPLPEAARLSEAARLEAGSLRGVLKSAHATCRVAVRTGPAPARAAVLRSCPRPETPLCSSHSHEGSRPSCL
jgi:hypothetical protein